MEFILDKNNLKTYILNRLRQEEIFAYYLDINVTYIDWCLSNKSYKINNPLRNDVNPSLGFSYKGNKVYFRDFANKYYNGDCFNLVAMLHNKDINNAQGFVETCNIIIDNMIYNKPKNIKLINICNNEVHITESKSKVIEIFDRRYNSNDLQYWKQFSIGEADLIENKVFAVSSYKVGEFYFTPKERVFAYYLDKEDDEQKWQLYFIDRKKHDKYPRFITNSNSHLQCTFELKKADNLLITKSRKDVIVLKKLIKSLPYHTVPSIAITSLTSENVTLPNKLIDNLFNLYSNIYSLTDLDKTGVAFARHHKKQGIIPLFLPAVDKDISGYVKNRGFEQGRELLIEFISEL